MGDIDMASDVANRSVSVRNVDETTKREGYAQHQRVTSTDMY